MKTVFAWVVNWGYDCTPRVSIDLFFSSEETAYSLLGSQEALQLVPIQVPEDFNDLDYIPENY